MAGNGMSRNTADAVVLFALSGAAGKEPGREKPEAGPDRPRVLNDTGGGFLPAVEETAARSL